MRTYYWNAAQNDNPLKTPFLGQFVLTDANILIPDEMLISLDREVSHFEAAVPGDVRSQLISRNELLTSFAISKAEKTNRLTIEEMRQIRAAMNSGLEGPGPYNESDHEALKKPKKAHDRLEYANILRTFRWSLEEGSITAGNLSVDLIRRVHTGLTEGLDFFEDKIMEFDPYRPGRIRDNDEIRVREYKPVDATNIVNELEELIRFYRETPSLRNLGLFHAGLYALHPFNNGNKRLCRILEHALIRNLGLNRGNIYSHSYFYYKQMNRFYGTLLKGLLSKNFTPIVNFGREAIFFSQLDVFRASIEQQRTNFIRNSLPPGSAINEGQGRVYSMFIKNKELNFTRIMKMARRMPDRTVAEYLKQGLARDVLEKRDVGKYSYYSLKLNTDEEQFLKERISCQTGSIETMPETFFASIYRSGEDWKPAGQGPGESAEKTEPEQGPAP